MKYIYIIGFAALLAACRHNAENAEPQSLVLRGDSVIILNKAIYESRIKVDTVRLEPFRTTITTSGIVRAIANNYAEVASPFAGRITRSYVRLGQHVKVDDPIFEISSPSYFEAGKAYFRARQELQLAEKNLHRQRDLLNNGVGIEKEVEEAEAAYDLAGRELENAVASLLVFKVKPDELVLGQPLIVRAPISGEIVDNNIVLGQYLREDAGPVVLIAELSRIWVVGQLKEKDLESVRESDEVLVRPTGMPGIPVKGKIYYISELLDEETRSVQVFIECPNEQRIMKPGMYVSAEFTAASAACRLVPVSAVFQAEDYSFVFVSEGPGLYLRRRIECGRNTDGKVMVREGLRPGERIVTDGGVLLLEAR